MRRRVLAAVLVIAAAACRDTSRQTSQELEPTPPERTDIPKIAREIPPREAVQGTSANTALLFAHAIPGMDARVEVREFYVPEGAGVAVPTPNETLFEIRGGQFDVQTS